MTSVYLLSNRTDDKIEKGQVLPYLVQAEQPSTVNVLIDSKDRTSGTPNDFRASFRHRIPRARYLQLKKAIMAKIPNVNPNNYSLQIKHDLGTTSVFTLPVGIYSTTALANQLTASINAQFVIDGIADSVTTSYDQNTRTFTMQTVSGANFFIVNTSTFITRGENLVNFPSEPVANVPSVNIIRSGISGMLYSRYLTVSSQALNTFSYASSVTTRDTQPTSLIGIIDLVDIYTYEDFDVSIPYAGVYQTLPIDGVNISVLNTQKSLMEEMDIVIQDEYGTVLDQTYDLGADYNTNSLGPVLMFSCTF